MNNDLQSWVDGAEAYLSEASEENDPFKKFIDTPKLIELLGDIKGKRVIDIGSGNGDLVKILVKNGANAVGLEGSQKMIDAARVNFAPGDYVLGDILDSDFKLLGESFDIAIAKMMLMNIAPISTFAKNASQLLKPGGLLVIDIVHPFRPLLKNLINAKASGYSSQFNYFNESNDGISFEGKRMAFYYRPLSMYINEILANGFQLVSIHELGVNEELASKYPDLNDKVNLPVSLHMVYRKQ